MRLIDADELIERISRNDDLPWNLDKACQTAFISCLKHTKTAYDIDKVKTQLKNITLEELNVTEAQFEMDQGEYSCYCSISLYDATQIIERGGME